MYLSGDRYNIAIGADLGGDCSIWAPVFFMVTCIYFLVCRMKNMQF